MSCVSGVEVLAHVQGVAATFPNNLVKKLASLYLALYGKQHAGNATDSIEDDHGSHHDKLAKRQLFTESTMLPF